MKRTRPLAGALVVGSVLALAACGGSSSSPGGSAGSTGGGKNLEVFSWWTSGSESAALNQLIDAYKGASSGAKVTNGAVAGGGGGNAQAILQTRLQGNDAPDTWQTHPGDAIKQYVDAGYVTDLQSVYAKDGLTKVMPKALVNGYRRTIDPARIIAFRREIAEGRPSDANSGDENSTSAFAHP